MSKPRRGKLYYSNDGINKHCIKLVPIRPKGWVIFCDERLMFYGMPMTLEAAQFHINDMKKWMEMKSQRLKDPTIYFNEVPTMIMPTDPPPGTQVGIIQHINEPEESVNLLPIVAAINTASAAGASCDSSVEWEDWYMGSGKPVEKKLEPEMDQRAVVSPTTKGKEV